MNETADEPEKGSFEREADASDPRLIAEFVDLLKYNKKWWLTPIIIIILLMAGLIMLGPAAPFIYPMF